MKYWPILSILVLVALSCKDTVTVVPRNGSIKFSVSSNSINGGRISEELVPAYFLVTIENSNGKVIQENTEISVYQFSNGYLSSALQLPVGAGYRLTQFLVLNSGKKIIYATPIEGSALAYLVDDPLPISFEISENKSTLVVPQVLEVNQENSADKFGYATFGLNIVKVKRIKTWEHRDNADRIRAFAEYAYDNELRLKAISYAELNTNTNAFDLSYVKHFKYMNGEIDSITFIYGDGSFFKKYVYHYDSVNEVSKIEIVNKDNMVLTHVDFQYNKNMLTILKYKHNAGNVLLALKSEFTKDGKNFVKCTDYWGGTSIYMQSEMQYDSKPNPLYFGQQYLTGLDVNIFELSFYSANNFTKQIIYNPPLSNSVPPRDPNYEVTYNTEYDVDGYPTKIKSDFYLKGGEWQWMKYGYYTIKYY